MRLRDRFLRRLFVFAIIATLGLSWAINGLSHINPNDPLGLLQPDAPAQTAANDNAPRIPEDRATHILYGDSSGGGHLHGMQKPCKSEFPAHWDADTVLKNIKIAAANDNAAWQRQNNGYYVAEVPVDGVKIRVVLNGRQDTVITAYPVNLRRNPCPAANDNNR